MVPPERKLLPNSMLNDAGKGYACVVPQVKCPPSVCYPNGETMHNLSSYNNSPSDQGHFMLQY
jgi:hypothetical protein